MPTSISHHGGRARAYEAGRYRKENNKNVTSQGLPSIFGKPRYLRNIISKRVSGYHAFKLLM